MIRLGFSPARSTRTRLLSMAGVAALFALSGHSQAQASAACTQLTPAELSAAYASGQCLELLAGIAPAAGPAAPDSADSRSDHGNNGDGHQTSGDPGNGNGNGSGGGQGNGGGQGGDGDQGNGDGGDQGNGGGDDHG